MSEVEIGGLGIRVGEEIGSCLKDHRHTAVHEEGGRFVMLYVLGIVPPFSRFLVV